MPAPVHQQKSSIGSHNWSIIFRALLCVFRRLPAIILVNFWPNLGQLSQAARARFAVALIEAAARQEQMSLERHKWWRGQANQKYHFSVVCTRLGQNIDWQPITTIISPLFFAPLAFFLKQAVTCNYITSSPLRARAPLLYVTFAGAALIGCKREKQKACYY